MYRCLLKVGRALSWRTTVTAIRRAVTEGQLMEHFIDAIAGFAKAHSLLAYGLVILLAGSEAVPVIGIMIPGTIGVVAIATLIPSGAVALGPMIACTMIGGFGGDQLVYLLGRRYKRRIMGIWPLNHRPELIVRGQKFFDRHGRKSVLMARFTPGARCVVPLAAGVTGMPASHFTSMNAVAVMVWAPMHVIEGLLAGTGVQWLRAAVGRVTAMIVGLLALLGLVGWGILRFSGAMG
jgi:membrane protein DedA with SNARE-associated domain